MGIILQSSHFNVLHEYFVGEIFAGIHYCENFVTSLTNLWHVQVMEEKLVIELCVCMATMFIKRFGKQLLGKNYHMKEEHKGQICCSCEKFHVRKYLRFHFNREHRENFYTTDLTTAMVLQSYILAIST